VAGTSGGVPYFSSASTWASSAALTANALMVGGGAGAAPSTVTTGTGVVTALGVNTGTAGAFVVNGGALGTPSSGTVTNLTGTASININGTVGATTANTGAFTTVTATTSVSSGVASTTQGSLILHNTSANSTTVKSSNSASAAYTITLPVDAGTSGQFLQTNGSGVTSWAAAGGGAQFAAVNASAQTGATSGVSPYRIALAFYVNSAQKNVMYDDVNTNLTGTSTRGISASRVISLTANDTVKLYGYCTAVSGTITFEGSGNYNCTFSGQYLHA
jgi:hypothetical protein